MKISVLCGGVGAARLLRGFQTLSRERNDLDITAIVNTADDDEFYGYFVCPDIDSILYHLAGLQDEERGWGRKDETFNFVETMRSLGHEAWFNLGDKDLALNHIRTSRLHAGDSLTDITQQLQTLLGITDIDIAPMCDEKVTTMISTDDGRGLRMQEYFVRERCAPVISEIRYESAPGKTTSKVRDALNDADLIVIAPSNPYLSIFPLFAIDEIDELVKENKDRTVAVSPIVGGQAVKGPLADILRHHNREVSPASIADMYRNHARTFILDSVDADEVNAIEDTMPNVMCVNTMMDSDERTLELARHIIGCAS